MRQRTRFSGNWLCAGAAIAALMLVVGAAHGTTLTLNDFVIYTDLDVTLGQGVIVDGPLGSNRNVGLGNLTNVKNIRAGGYVGFGDLSGGQSLTINGDIVANGGVSFQNSSPGSVINGNVDGASNAGKQIQIGTGVTINGDVTSGHGLVNNGTINGNQTAFGSPLIWTGLNMSISAVQTAMPEALASFSAGSVDKSGGTIAPGSYKELSVGSGGAVNLSSGVYYFSRFTVGENGQVNINLSGGSGTIAVYVVGEVNLGKNVHMNLVGGDAGDVFFQTSSKWMSREGWLWYGDILALLDDADFGGTGAVFEGRYFGKKLLIQGGTYTEMDGGGGGDLVPEPLTMLGMALGLGSVGAYIRKHRKA